MKKITYIIFFPALLTNFLYIDLSSAGIISSIGKKLKDAASRMTDESIPYKPPHSRPRSPHIKPFPTLEHLKQYELVKQTDDDILDGNLKWLELNSEHLKYQTYKLPNYYYVKTNSYELTVDNPILLFALPTTKKQYKNIYRKNHISYGIEKSISSLSKKVSETRRAYNFDGGKNELLHQIDKSDQIPIVIFAHSENSGKMLILPTGEKILVSDIHSYCIKTNKVCAVLTCYGDDFKLNDKITAEGGLRMWDYALKNKGKMSAQRFIYYMRKKKVTDDRIAIAKPVLSASGTTGGVGYYYYSE